MNITMGYEYSIWRLVTSTGGDKPSDFRVLLFSEQEDLIRKTLYSDINDEGNYVLDGETRHVESVDFRDGEDVEELSASRFIEEGRPLKFIKLAKYINVECLTSSKKTR